MFLRNFSNNPQTKFATVLLASLTLSALFTACLFDGNAAEPDDDLIVRQVFSVDSLEILTNANNTLLLKSSAGVPNPCFEYSHADISQEGSDIYVNIFARTLKSTVCIQVLGQIEANTEIKVDAPGSYNLHLVGEFQTLDTTVVIQ